MVKGTKGKVTEFAVDFRGKWFDPLVQDQHIKGVYVREFKTDSKFKNLRDDSDNFGKKAKSNYEVQTDKGRINFSESGGPLQALMDSVSVGDRVEIGFKCLEANGVECPKSVKTVEQLKKWKKENGGRAYPRFIYLRKISK